LEICRDRLNMFKELTEAPGVSGYESEVRKVIRKYAEPYSTIEYDNLGSIVCKKEGSGPSPKIMIPGHIDEIGFMVTNITDEGFIKFIPLGGWWDQVMLAQKVVIKASSGDVVGLVGSKPPHILTAEEKKKVVEKKDMFIDIGAADAGEATQAFGIRPGDPIIPVSPFEPMKNEKLLMAKAWDDRVGAALFIDVLKELNNFDHPNTVYGVGTVQEEVGLRGAQTSAAVVEPDVCIALEVAIAGDMPGMKKDESPNEKLGKGPVILLADATMIPNIFLRDLIVKTAEENNIPYQFSAMMGGGTDGGKIHMHARGVPSIVLGVPTRYIHSHTGILHYEDYMHTKNLLVELMKKLDAETVDSLKRSN
jgi:putative aminopeptidase FrvX